MIPGMGGKVLGITAGSVSPPAPPPVPASFVFNGTNEALVRVMSTTAASDRVITWSCWIKVLSYDGGSCDFFQALSADEAHFFVWKISDSGDLIELFQDAVWGEEASGLAVNVPLNTWEHWVLQLDSTQAVADNRVRFYRNGTLQADTATAQIVLNGTNLMFNDGSEIQLGGELDIGFFTHQKLAFVDVLEGESKLPTDFAFLNGAVWTRKPYVGLRGNYGFLLDGTDGFNDVSGNNQHFSGVNMDATNLDTADLPPHVMV